MLACLPVILVLCLLACCACVEFVRLSHACAGFLVSCLCCFGLVVMLVLCWLACHAYVVFACLAHACVSFACLYLLAYPPCLCWLARCACDFAGFLVMLVFCWHVGLLVMLLIAVVCLLVPWLCLPALHLACHACVGSPCFVLLAC